MQGHQLCSGEDERLRILLEMLMEVLVYREKDELDDLLKGFYDSGVLHKCHWITQHGREDKNQHSNAVQVLCAFAFN